MTAFLIANPPRTQQFRDRGRAPTGLIVVHTAESAPDTAGADGGAEAVARFIQARADYGSYHLLCDSDSMVELVPLSMAAYGDGTGSNSFAIHLSAATQAHRWPDLPEAWVEGCIEQMARAAAHAAAWLQREHGITVPAERVTRAESDRGLPGFISHGERDPGRRTDPGAAFPWARFLDRFAQLTQGDDMAQYDEQLDTIQADAAEAKRLAQQTLQEVRATRKAQGAKIQGVKQLAQKILAESRDDATKADIRRIITKLDEPEPFEP